MSIMSKNARSALKSKAQRLVGPDPRGTPIDASGYTPPDAEDASVQTGMRPLSKRQFKKGGKVIGKYEGKDGHHHAGRKPRKSGGRANRFLTPDNLINRDVKMANDERVGTKHVGGMKRGGKAEHKLGGGMVGNNPVAQSLSNTANAAIPPSAMGRKDGGKAKWIQGAIKHEGSLHKALHVSAGKKIPAKKLSKAEHSKNPKLAKKAHLAETLKHMHHAKGGKAMSEFEWKHSKEDEREDRILAKKHHMTPMQWEKSKLNEKHDKQQSMKGLKHGGEVHHASCGCSKCWGGRAGKKDGGRNIMEVTGVRPTGGRTAKKDGGRDVRDPEMPMANYNFLTGWSDLDKATPDQIAAMNPQDRQMALAAQGSSRAVAPAHVARRAAPVASSASGSADHGMMDPAQRAAMLQQAQQVDQRAMRADNAQVYSDAQNQANALQQAARSMRADNAAVPASLRPDQQQNMMGRGLPPSRTDYGLFQGQAGEPAMVFSRQVPDANVAPAYHDSSDNSAPIPIGDLGEMRGGRIGRKDGGRTKGKGTNVNIVIAPHHPGMGQAPAGMMGQPPAGGARPVPVPPPQGMPPQGMPMGMPQGVPQGMPGGMPPQGMPPQMGGMAMARKSGGRANYPIDTGAGGANARLEKIKAYGLKPAR